jgi:ABC-type Fe3+-hydroxamate transport system substrate-binding protein
MKKKQSVDQLNRLIEFNFPPQRIISLVPSQTELLFDLDLGERVVGITKFCVHPKDWLRTKTKIGGTKKFQFDTIDALQPDLILGNKEENYIEGIHQLAAKYPVWISDIASWESAMEMILSLGDLVNENIKADRLVTEIRHRFENAKLFSPVKALYLIWRNPWMAAGKNTFIDTLLSKTGLMNVLRLERYPELSLEEIKDLSPEIILLSSEPFPFQHHHMAELQYLLPASKIILVDGEMFSWYGSRLLKAPDYFSSIAI